MDILQQLTAATTESEREAIVLAVSLSALPADVQAAVQAAAVPHWFSSLFLDALLATESDELYDDLLTLNFVEYVPGKGYAIHERTRHYLLHTLWQNNRDQFRELSSRAADYCDAHANETDDPEWQAEAIYHRLVSNPDEGVAGFRELATKWANYEYHTYEEIERTVRWANEQIEAGRLTGTGADWTRLWQAKLALMYGHPDLAAPPLNQITKVVDTDPYLAAETAQTYGDMLADMDDQARMERAWKSAYTLYMQLADGQGQLDAYLVADKMRQYGSPDPAAAIETDTQPKTPPSKNALKLIDNISAAWIDGVLKTTLDETIDLQMGRSGSQLSNLVYHGGQSVDRPIAAGQRLSRLFAAADHSLLILGAPGSGKTITLLQLLDELLQQAKLDAKVPIPLLFNLSSFGAYAQEEDGDLRNWLAEQAYDQYRLKRETTREQLAEAGSFILLLDGLDEVPEGEGQREDCVNAINEFVQVSPCGLVVCSRIGDYEALNNKLALSHALVLQPLTNQQIEQFIEQVGNENRAAMQAQLQTDWQLQEALRSPLLLNLYSLAFPTLLTASEKTKFSTEDSVEARRKILFSTYVDTVFATSAETTDTDSNDKISKEKSMYWLSFLSNRMQQTGRSLFFIEEMQPTWLPHFLVRRYRGIYGSFIGLIMGLSVGLILGLIYGISGEVRERLSDWLIYGLEYRLKDAGSNVLIFGLYVGLSSGMAGGITTWITTSIRRPKLRIIIGGFLFWLIFGLIELSISIWLRYGILYIRYYTRPYLPYSLRANLRAYAGLIILSGLIIGMVILFKREPIIQLLNRLRVLRSSSNRIFSFIKYGLIIGLIIGLILRLLHIIEFFSRNDLIMWLIIGLGMIISGGVLASWAFEIQLRERVTALWPSRHRIFRFVKNSFFWGLVIGLVIGILFLSDFISTSKFNSIKEFIDDLIYFLPFALMIDFIIGLIFALFGGLIGLILAFVDTPLVDTRPKSGEGIHASLRNALLTTLLASLFLSLPVWYIDRVTGSGYMLLIIVLINVLPSTFTWFGGLAWCQHWALRVVITQQKWLPLRLISWLDSMVELGLLRRVGGGYIFIHRSLLEYFAELEEWPEMSKLL